MSPFEDNSDKSSSLLSSLDDIREALVKFTTVSIS
jgi:hypothetical protein